MGEGDLDWVVAEERELHAFPWTHGNFADALAAGYHALVMRDADGAPMGYAVLLTVIDEAHLLNISVSRRVQGRGFGRRLLEHLCDEARRNSVTQLFLEVRPSNLPALALYHSAGFVAIGRRKGYYPATDGREDAIVMRLDL